jgi:hypothetical protein
MPKNKGFPPHPYLLPWIGATMTNLRTTNPRITAPLTAFLIQKSFNIPSLRNGTFPTLRGVDEAENVPIAKKERKATTYTEDEVIFVVWNAANDAARYVPFR